MKQAGQIVLVPFPFTDLSGAVMGGCNEFVNGSPRGLRKIANE
ncbi:hypothetical protein [uncultured Thiodictyon sp.]|nr:hypothetical protein [uncultured Thiodictyon sp.]